MLEHKVEGINTYSGITSLRHIKQQKLVCVCLHANNDIMMRTFQLSVVTSVLSPR